MRAGVGADRDRKHAGGALLLCCTLSLAGVIGAAPASARTGLPLESPSRADGTRDAGSAAVTTAQQVGASATAPRQGSPGTPRGVGSGGAPAPNSAVMTGLGLLGLAFYGRRRRCRDSDECAFEPRARPRAHRLLLRAS